MHLNLMPSDPCVCISSRKAANALTNLYDDALAKSGIKITQYSLMKNIHRSTEITINELAKDLRKSIVKLSINGQKVLKKAQASWEEAQKRAKKILGKDLAYYIELNKKLSELSLDRV
jgi:DNA-binding MarR family transcriptional regulator